MASRIEASNIFSSPARSAKELMRADGELFVRWAYITLLGRPADPEGLQFYLRRMRDGKTKVSIIKQISWSPEGKAYNARLPGAAQLIRRALLKRAPVVGPIYRWLLKSDQTPRLPPPAG